MRTRLMAILLALVAVVGVVGPRITEAQGVLFRLSAEFLCFGDAGCPSEKFTNAGVPGVKVYAKSVFVPFGVNTLYVTFSGTADTHDGAQLLLSCNVGGVFCNPGGGGAAGSPAGWITVQRLPNGGANGSCNNGGGGPGDCHDNSIFATWCVDLARVRLNPPATAPVELRLASAGGTNPQGAFVFFEKAHVYIDANDLDPGCGAAAADPDDAGAATVNPVNPHLSH